MEINSHKSLKTMRSRSVEGLISLYNAVFHPTLKFPIHLMPVAQALVDRRIDKLGVIIGPGSGKALHPDTEILTIEGWKKIGDVTVGELVKTPHNSYAKIEDIIIQPPSRLYRIDFEDGRRAIAHEGHLWKVLDIDDPYFKLVETIDMYFQPNYRIPVVPPIEFPDMELYFSPFFMGKVCSTVAFVNVNKGYINSLADATGEEYNVELFYRLFFNKEDILFPEFLKQMSIRQKYEFIKGYFSKNVEVRSIKGITYYVCSSFNIDFLKGFRELIWSLGGKAYLMKHASKLFRRKRLYIRLDIPDDYIDSRLKTKYVEKCIKNPFDKSLGISYIAPYKPGTPSVCITLDEPEGMFIIRGYIQTHNSQLISVLYPLWEIGLDPTTTILNVSAGENLPQGFLSSVMNTIESNDAYRAVFPSVVPDRSRGWSLDKGLFVEGHVKSIPDANYFAVGIQSSALTGKHAKIIIMDDIHSEQNSATPDQCSKISDSYYKTIIGRADPMGARYIVAGRRWGISDVYQVLKSSESWVFMTLPAVRDGESELYYDVTIPDGVTNVFTEGGFNEEA